MKTLPQINVAYEEIMQLSEPKKSHLLADLMSEMERDYKIPMVRSEAWEKENRVIIAMYRKLSISRDL